MKMLEDKSKKICKEKRRDYGKFEALSRKYSKFLNEYKKIEHNNVSLFVFRLNHTLLSGFTVFAVKKFIERHRTKYLAQIRRQLNFLLAIFFQWRRDFGYNRQVIDAFLFSLIHHRSHCLISLFIVVTILKDIYRNCLYIIEENNQN